MKEIISQSLNNAMSYNEFKTVVFDLLQEGKSTGENQSDTLLNYSLLSDKRMKRLDKKIIINNDVKNIVSKIDKNITFLVLMESWCGDGAQTLPVINKIAKLSPNIKFKVVLRDENETLMNAFLTNGNKSIPKVIIFEDANYQVLNSWGPRPSQATKMVNDFKMKHGKLNAEFKKDLQIWYNKDKGKSTQDDFIAILKSI